MARRGFLRYILEEMSKAQTAQGSHILSYKQELKKFQIYPQFSFHFFTTHPPCGDASIFDITNAEEPAKKIRKVVEDSDDIGDILGNINYTHITGGKLIENSNVDRMAQIIGEIRTKPGRGIPTKSVSCSDKLSKWNIVGIQGALLAEIVEPLIYLSSVTLCGVCDMNAIQRAIWKRWVDRRAPEGFKLQIPNFQSTNKIMFEYSKSAELNPSPSSSVWCKVESR